MSNIIYFLIIIILILASFSFLKEKMENIENKIKDKQKENFEPDGFLPPKDPNNEGAPINLVKHNELNPNVILSPYMPQLNKEIPNTLKNSKKRVIELEANEGSGREKEYIEPWILMAGKISAGGKDLPKQNYPNPWDMDETVRNAFKLGYPPDLTMQDYVNWLYLWEYDSDGLTLNHRENLEKLLSNQELYYRDGVCPPPYKKLLPLGGEVKYFQNLYRKKNKDIWEKNYATPLGQSEILPANNGDFNDFTNNFDLLGSSEMPHNPDLGEKVPAKVLNKFVNGEYLNQGGGAL